MLKEIKLLTLKFFGVPEPMVAYVGDYITNGDVICSQKDMFNTYEPMSLLLVLKIKFKKWETQKVFQLNWNLNSLNL